ncbi:alpha/beta fold hydrolase [Micromonospora sp. ALFpr18c]|uniref:alpha/beta fold hydrolase n=1 Tax=Micromonospora sp. ALFpr18c TaxID=1458665 RepID=UPI001788A75C
MFSTTRAATAAAFSPALAGAGLHETYLDLPGHGDSPATDHPASQAILDTVCAWLDRHTDAPVLLAGASYGAYLAAGIARQRPDRSAACSSSARASPSHQPAEPCPTPTRQRRPPAGSTPPPPTCTRTSTPRWATAPRASSPRSSPR